MNDLIATWLRAQSIEIESSEYAEVGWAVNKLFDMAHDDPDALLTIVVNILEVDSSPKVLGAIGAGVLEDLLVHHGDEYINTMVELAERNKNFKACLRFTYLDKDDVSTLVYQKYQELFINYL
jgi:hypothetical protein